MQLCISQQCNILAMISICSTYELVEKTIDINLIDDNIEK